MADKLGSKIPKMGEDMLDKSLGSSLLKIVAFGIAGGLALITMADQAGKRIEKRNAERKNRE